MNKETNDTKVDYVGEGLEAERLDLNPQNQHMLTCPNCNHFISAIDINIDKTIAKCSNCSHVFDFSENIKAGYKPLDFSRPGMMIPEGLEVLRLRSELDIEVNWFKTSSKAGFASMMFFTLVWNLVLLPFVLSSILSGQLQILLFAAVHILVGVTLLYNLAAMFLNTSQILVNEDYIEFSTFPLRLPWAKKTRYSAKKVKQIYVSKYVSSSTNGVSNYAYALYAIMDNGQKVKLLDKMNLETQLYLEQEIERFLKIKDRRVPGGIK